MAMVDVNDSCQFLADSQPKCGLTATRRSVYVHQMNTRNDFGHDDSTINIVVVIIIIIFIPQIERSPGLKTTKAKIKMSNGQRSGRSTGRVLCKSTELKRCSMIEMRWKRYEVSLASPV